MVLIMQKKHKDTHTHKLELTHHKGKNNISLGDEFVRFIYLSLFKIFKDFKIQFMYFFNNLWKYYLKKDEASGPHRKMVSVPGNQLSSTKSTCSF